MLGDGSDPDYVALAEGGHVSQIGEKMKRARLAWSQKYPEQEQFKKGGALAKGGILNITWFDIDRDLDKAPNGLRGLTAARLLSLLDRVDYRDKSKTSEWEKNKSYPEYSSDVDPVYIAPGSNTRPMLGCGRDYFFHPGLGSGDEQLAYLCIGPDLLAEQAKAK